MQRMVARFPVMATFAGACLLLLPACSSSSSYTGDFGRRPNNVITTTALPKAGLLSAWVRGDAVSLYPFTDDEIELRDRAWRFLMPAHDKVSLLTRLTELSYTRVLPPLPYSGRNHYHFSLMTEDYRSVASRYSKIGQDVEADRLLMVPFSQAAARVCAADRVRVNSLKHVSDLTSLQRDQAAARVAENRGLVDWVRRDMRAKAAGYRYALEQLTVEAPMREAIRAEQAVVALESAQQTLDFWEGCGDNTLPVPPVGRRGPMIPPPNAASGERFAPMNPGDVQDKRGLLETGKPPK